MNCFGKNQINKNENKTNETSKVINRVKIKFWVKINQIEIFTESEDIP